MKRIFRIEKIRLHDENMKFLGTQIRIKFFNKQIVSYNLKTNKSLLNPI